MANQHQPVSRSPHNFGAFVEGFDSILYAPTFPCDNQVRFLAELFYAFVYDSKLLLSENMVFDNRIMMRCLSKLKKYPALAARIDYVARDVHASPLQSISNGFLKPTYVCSALTPETEKLRIEILTGSAQDDPKKTASQLLPRLKRATTDRLDLIVCDYLEELIAGHVPWQNVFAGVPREAHGYRMDVRLKGWLQLDAESIPSPRGEPSFMAALRPGFSDPQFWKEGQIPEEKEGQSFESYFSGRSHFHASMDLWREVLAGDRFDRLEEYVNSAYMEALEKTVSPKRAVKTPGDFSNAGNKMAQEVMNFEIRQAPNNFEFKLAICDLLETDADSPASHNLVNAKDRIEAIEDTVLVELEELMSDPSYGNLQQRLNELKSDDPAYRDQYCESFGNLANFVNQRVSMLRLELQANRVATVIVNSDRTELTRCEREVVAEDEMAASNGNEAVASDRSSVG